MFKIQKTLESLIQTVNHFELIMYPDKNNEFYGGNIIPYQYNKTTNFIDMTLAYKVKLRTSQTR